jgi:hypothetical protein
MPWVLVGVIAFAALGRLRHRDRRVLCGLWQYFRFCCISGLDVPLGTAFLGVGIGSVFCREPEAHATSALH